MEVELQLIPDSNIVPTHEHVVYELDDEAKAHWLSLANSLEAQMQYNGFCHDISDFASKANEIVVRVSAILHHFGEQTGKISCATLMRAAEIVNFHLHEYKRVMAGPDPLVSIHQDAQKLLKFLHENYFSKNIYFVPKNQLLQYGPLRKKLRLESALMMLTASNNLYVNKDTLGRTFVYANLNPAPQSVAGHL